MSSTTSDIPVLLLKTKSIPADGYQEIFAGWNNYLPTFLPVLEHRFREDALTWLKDVTSGGGFGFNHTIKVPDRYGGIIFTSQRAVEAFTSIVESLDPRTIDELLPEAIPLYVVGPATARGLRSLGLKCQIIGEETGNGAALSAFMLDHYNRLPAGQTVRQDRKLPLLFLVGEVRRDIIPKSLQSSDISQGARIGVHEVVIYETCEMASFHIDFARALEENIVSEAKEQWVVVFSPQGCRAMLDCLGWLDEAGHYRSEVTGASPVTTYIATIGPTTRDYLVSEFGFEPHVSAEKPSPEGIYAAIESYRNTNSKRQL
ncbi:uroporphyrinogen-III synthase-like protein [Aureobasidium subglaciale]|nr:uroporphyrinogen-III synthase-like protein [Aureobasidium subglaciale]